MCYTWRATKSVRNTWCASPAGVLFQSVSPERDACKPSTFPPYSSASCGPQSRRRLVSLLPKTGHWKSISIRHTAHLHTIMTPPVLSSPETASGGLPGTPAEVLLQDRMAYLIPVMTVPQRHPTFRRGWFLPRIFELPVLLTDRRA